MSEATTRRLLAYTGGLLGASRSTRRIRRILALSGWHISTGLPRSGDTIAVWGHSPHAWRGEALAARSGAALLRLEDAFVRSLNPGRSGEPPVGLLIDPEAAHFNPAIPSRLENLLAKMVLDDAALLSRAHEGMARMQALNLSKYNNHDIALPPPAPGYVLVIDQTRQDASLTHGGMNGPLSDSLFREMLVFAQEENPGRRVLIKTHPETRAGYRPGHYGPEHETENVQLLRAPIAPHTLLDGAVAVYTVSSLMGFEAIMAGHKPRVFGHPFYAGWGLTQDENPVPRRSRRLSRAQLFAAAMILYPTWYDPCRDRLCSFEEMLDHMEAQLRAWRQDRHGHVALGMRLWKRAGLQRFFGTSRRMRFAEAPARAIAQASAEGRGLMVWAGKETPDLARAAQSAGLPLLRIEDGFLRSKGLGAALTPAMSLVADDLGIYYDPGRASRLERLIGAQLPPGGAARAEQLRSILLEHGLSKYNLSTESPDLDDLPAGRRILVPGQVEDDASIRLGAGAERSNLELLRRVRAENPDAVILYKPHPDVEAGLRQGAVAAEEAGHLADRVLATADPARLIAACDEVWTITSLLGFEALLRGKPVTCLGTPFYAGWGLTRDLGPVPARRQARPDLTTLIHAALIAYPRYHDPVSNLPCPPEVVAERLAQGLPARPALPLRSLSKLQGLLASHSFLWR